MNGWHSVALVIAILAALTSVFKGNVQAALGWFSCSIYIALVIVDA